MTKGKIAKNTLFWLFRGTITVVEFKALDSIYYHISFSLLEFYPVYIKS